MLVVFPAFQVFLFQLTFMQHHYHEYWKFDGMETTHSKYISSLHDYDLINNFVQETYH